MNGVFIGEKYIDQYCYLRLNDDSCWENKIVFYFIWNFFLKNLFKIIETICKNKIRYAYGYFNKLNNFGKMRHYHTLSLVII